MTRKICLKCLEVTHFGGEHCTRCGEKLVDFTLMCECGAGKPVKDYLKELRWLFSQAK